MQQPGRYEQIDCQLGEEGRLLVLALKKPPANILTSAMMTELSAALAAHRDHAGLKLVCLRGAGEHFSFGASVQEHRPESAAEMLRVFHQLIRDVALYPVPVAALVDGKCLGGAFELALACHLVLATRRARFGCPEIKLGVFPPALAVLGPVRLGAATAERLLITGAELDAERAWSLGMLAELIEGDVTEAGRAYYEKTLAGYSAFSLRQAVGAARDGMGMPEIVGARLAEAERRYLTALLPSHDGNEGIAAFLAKRQAKWRDA